MSGSEETPRLGGNVRSCIRMRIPLDKQNEALEILGASTARVRADSRCLRAGLYRGLDDVRTLMVEEVWQSSEDVLQRLRSEDYRNVLLVLEMAEEAPDIRFDTIANSGGMDVIRKARLADLES